MPKVTREQSQITREKIIDVAFHLFLEQGFHATSLRQIVETSGVTMGGIYNHFNSKEKIWEAVFIEKHPFHQLLPALQQIKGNTAEEIIRSSARYMVDELGKHPEVTNIMLIEIVEFKGVHMSMIYEVFAPGFLQFGQLLTSYANHLRDIPIPSIARAFAGLFFSYYMTSWIIPENYRSMFNDTGLDDFISIYLHGILSE